MKGPEMLLAFTSRDEWRAWLEAHHGEAREAWLTHRKKGATSPCLSYEEGVEEALCFGWIDGMLRSIDGATYALRYSPRKPGSVWSETNKRRVGKLVGEGRMTAAGLAQVSEAKANGQWEAATRREDVETIPPDLEVALREHETAWGAFTRWPPSHKRQYLYWVEQAKRPETRQKRIVAVVERAAAG